MLRPPTVDFESLTLTALFILSSEYLRTFLEIIDDIPRNVWQHSPECLATFPGMFKDIHRNVWRYSPGHNNPFIPRIPAFCPPFLYSWF